MNNRIEQMNKSWQELEAQKKSQKTHQQMRNEAADLNAIPLPSYLKMPKIVVPASVNKQADIARKNNPSSQTVLSDGIIYDSNQKLTSAASQPNLTSSTPRISANRKASFSTSNIDLPELPAHLIADEFIEATGSSPSSSMRSNSVGSTEPGAATKESGKRWSKRFEENLSEQFSKFTKSISDFAQNISPRGHRSQAEKSSPPKQSSPGRADPRLAGLTIDERQDIAIEMAKYCQTDAYRNAIPAQQSLQFDAKLTNLLKSYPDFQGDGKLKLLNAEIAWRMKYAVIDTVVDLNDPEFVKFVENAAGAAFMKPWDHENVDGKDPVTGLSRKNADTLKRTFLRDFDHSNYFAKKSDGTLEKIIDSDQFIALVGPGENGELAKIVSNIASQNLGNFLKNILFLRTDSSNISQSILRLHDETPIMPLATLRANYVFEKDAAGRIILDYESNASNEINGAKPLSVRRMTGDNATAGIADASLNIKVRVVIEPSGDWSIGNPLVRAEGWNIPAGD